VHEIRLIGLKDECHNDYIINLIDLESIMERSIVINWAYYLRKNNKIFQQDLFPLSQLVRLFQLFTRAGKPSY
jgi:hypothetical protein